MLSDFSIYFHIPFCQKKCPYCHFYSLQGSKEIFNDFLKALKIEWQQKKELFLNKKLLSLYLGGGTPTLLGPKRIEEILSLAQKSFSLENVEITLEANPETTTFQDLLDFKKIGINRLSLGIQSFDDHLLKILQRPYLAKEAEEITIKSFEAGIKNISIDLLYDLPTQTLSTWEMSLKTALKLPVSHLSIYNLIFEPNTPFFRKKETLLPLLPSSQTSLKMLKRVQTILLPTFTQYEISAFAKEKKYSIHNTGYWTGRDFLGFGPSAFSYIAPKRFQNVSNLSIYLNKLFQNLSPKDFEEELSYPKNLQERLAIALRQTKGIKVIELEKLGKLPKNITDTLTFLEKKKLLTFKEEIQLTEKGLLLYDSIAQELI